MLNIIYNVLVCSFLFLVFKFYNYGDYGSYLFVFKEKYVLLVL